MFGKVSVETKALVLSEVAIAALSVYRLYDYAVTGFFVSDEYGYFYDATHGVIYGGRWFFGGFNILLFKTPGLASVNGFELILPFYLFFWSGLTIYVFYKIVRLIGLNQNGVALSLLSAFALVSFVLLSLGFLTEPVGLALTMAGLYCLLRYFKSASDNGRLLFPIAAAAFLGAAGGTREPYNALLVAGALLVIIVANSKRRESGVSRYGRMSLALLSITLFVLPGGFFYYANSYATSQVPSIGGQLGHSIIANPPLVAKTTITQTATSNATQVFTRTLVQTSVTTIVTSTVTTILTTISGTATNATLTVPQTETRTNTSTITTTLTTSFVTTSTRIVVSEPNYPYYAKSLLLNTFAIFAGGIILGWGPLAFLVALAGFIIVVGSVLRTREMLRILILLASLASLGSYFVVSYIFAPDPSYLSFQNYSTIIRFSDTALPAYFLLAPFAIAHISSRRRAFAFGTTVIVFLLLAIPAYEVYASSNLNYAAGNPFSLGYRTPAIQVRGYISAHPDLVFRIVGVPYGWYFTPGVENLRNVSVYPLNAPSLTPPINYSQFVKYGWSSFYIYSSPSFTELRSYAPYLYSLVNPDSNLTGTKLPYHLLTSQVLVNGTGYVFVRIQLAWTPT